MNRLFKNAKVIFNNDRGHVYSDMVGRVEIEGDVILLTTPDATVCTHISNVVIFSNYTGEEPATNGHIQCPFCDDLIPADKQSEHWANYHHLPF